MWFWVLVFRKIFLIVFYFWSGDILGYFWSGIGLEEDFINN